MARKRKTHDFENCPPAPCLHQVDDPRRETTAKPMFDQSVQSSKPFIPLFGGEPFHPGGKLYDSQTDGNAGRRAESYGKGNKE